MSSESAIDYVALAGAIRQWARELGFQQIGMAPTYLHIDGHWQDCNLYQRILNDREPGA